jgi:apolipoprotein N-acyltransferase
VYWVPAAIDAAWVGEPGGRRGLAWALGAVLAGHAFGALRLAGSGGETAVVATVGTDSDFHGLPLPSPADERRIEDAIFARTLAAAHAGARLVSWTEGATYALPADEAALVARGQAVAREARIELVMAYVVPLRMAPLEYENKYVWIRPDGRVDHRYLKHRPVPGEPAVAGSGPPTVVDTAVGRASGAICYDYDFPRIGLAHAALGLDLVVVPSSDWSGIDPIHTQMAGLHAIEGGFSLLRSTRFGLSAGIDPYGRMRASQSSFTSGTGVLLVALPTHRVWTLYAVIGDLFVYLCAGWLLVGAALARLAGGGVHAARYPLDHRGRAAAGI